MSNNEIWKQIPMFPLYAASNLGRIKNIKKDKVMVQKSNEPTRPYQVISLYDKGKRYTKRVARLVWAAFNGCECEQTINHIDSNAKNNHISNLECISMQENCSKRHIYKRGINKYGLTDDIRRQILLEHSEGTTVYRLSIKYNLPSNYIYGAISRGSWKHLCWNEDTENSKNSQSE